MPIQIAHQQVKEIELPTENGITEPYFCRLDDGNLYVVKGKQAGFMGLIAETVAALLGRSMGLPIPEFAIAEVSKELLAFNPKAASSIGTGTVFASKFKPGTIEFGPALIDKVPTPLLAELFAFDAWIQNEDRTFTEFGGNPNLFLRVETDELVAIDHNLAFRPGFKLAKNFAVHACRGAWLKQASDLLFKEALRKKMDVALANIQGYESELPEAWLEGAPGFTEQINAALIRYQSDAFWNELKP